MKVQIYQLTQTEEMGDYKNCVLSLKMNGHSPEAIDDFVKGNAKCLKVFHEKDFPQGGLASVLLNKKGEGFIDQEPFDDFYLQSFLESCKQQEKFPHLYLPTDFRKYSFLRDEIIYPTVNIPIINKPLVINKEFYHHVQFDKESHDCVFPAIQYY